MTASEVAHIIESAYNQRNYYKNFWVSSNTSSTSSSLQEANYKKYFEAGSYPRGESPILVILDDLAYQPNLKEVKKLDKLKLKFEGE